MVPTDRTKSFWMAVFSGGLSFENPKLILTSRIVLIALIVIDPLQAVDEVGEIALALAIEDLHRYNLRLRSRAHDPYVILRTRGNNSRNVCPMSVVIGVWIQPSSR